MQQCWNVACGLYGQDGGGLGWWIGKRMFKRYWEWYWLLVVKTMAILAWHCWTTSSCDTIQSTNKWGMGLDPNSNSTNKEQLVMGERHMTIVSWILVSGSSCTTCCLHSATTGCTRPCHSSCILCCYRQRNDEYSDEVDCRLCAAISKQTNSIMGYIWLAIYASINMMQLNNGFDPGHTTKAMRKILHPYAKQV